MIVILWLTSVLIILFFNYCANTLAEKSNYYLQNFSQP